MVDMPMTEDDRDPRGVELVSNPLRAFDRQVSVVDQRFAAVDNRVTGDSEHKRTVVQPVRLIVLALALAPVVEGEDALGRLQEPHRTILVSLGDRDRPPSCTGRAAGRPAAGGLRRRLGALELARPDSGWLTFRVSAFSGPRRRTSP